MTGMRDPDRPLKEHHCGPDAPAPTAMEKALRAAGFAPDPEQDAAEARYEELLSRRYADDEDV